ncbi:hypothetical protein V6N13_090632 [Hibiscus sabdariffa]|uniref:Uncharacterized protein n=2 Tax=Hibiscus sabdariffa TaxID=183260 RepID=A0ABR2B6U2_9ROSI
MQCNHQVSLPGLVTQACHPIGGIKAMKHWVIPCNQILAARISLADSKLGVGPWDFSESYISWILEWKAQHEAWFHRTTRTSRSQQWKDYRSVCALIQ